LLLTWTCTQSNARSLNTWGPASDHEVGSSQSTASSGPYTRTNTWSGKALPVTTLAAIRYCWPNVRGRGCLAPTRFRWVNTSFPRSIPTFSRWTGSAAPVAISASNSGVVRNRTATAFGGSLAGPPRRTRKLR
jgi:hypothetical protein